MKSTLAGVVGVVLIVAQSAAQSPRAWSEWPSTGPTCQSFLEATGQERDLLVTFTLGFIAGTNRERAGQRQVWFPAEQTEVRMQTYCEAHPTDPMASSAFALVDENR